MATPPASWLPWLRFKRAVGRWCEAGLGFAPGSGAVLWADHDVQRPPLPYLGLQVVSGPTRRRMDARSWPTEVPHAVTVRVLPSAVAAPGDLLNLFVNLELFSHEAAPGDTVATVRGALVAAVNASVQLGVTAAPQGADSLVLTASRPGSLRVEAALGCEVTSTTTRLVAMTTGSREVRVRATAYGAPEPRSAGDVGVAEWVELLAEAGDDPDLALELRRHGVVCSRVSVLQQPASAPSGADRETRAFADLVFTVEVRRGRPVDAWLGEVEIGEVDVG